MEPIELEPSSEETAQPAKKKYRLESTSIFYTWPQCSTPKEQVLKSMVKGLSKYDIDFILVCQEKHQDGSPHLHALSVCSKKRCCWTPHWADKFADKHGDYTNARSIRGSVEYIKKAGDWIVYPEGFDLDARLASATPTGRKRKVTDDVANMIHEGKTYHQLLLADTHRGFFLLNSRKIQEYETEIKRARLAASAQRSLEPWQSLPLKDSMTSCEVNITSWLNENMTGEMRRPGTPQLYLYGTTGCGKTHLVTQLRRFFRVYDVCMEEDWMDDYNDDDYDLVVFEEFKAQKKITWLNRFLDGQVCSLSRRGKAPYIKRKNIPVIILSNYSLSGAFVGSSEGKLAPLDRRLQQIDASFDHNIGKPIQIL